MTDTLFKDVEITIRNMQIAGTDQVVPIQIITLPDQLTPTKWELMCYVSQLKEFQTPQTRLFNFLVDTADSNGLIIMSQQELSKASGMPMITLSRSMTALQNKVPPIVTRVKQGVYKLNADIVKAMQTGKPYGVIYRHKSDGPIPEDAMITPIKVKEET